MGNCDEWRNHVETISRQLAALTSRVAEMWRDMMQLREDVSELRQDMAQMRKDMALANTVLDEHNRKFAEIYRTLGIVTPTASVITSGVRGGAMAQKANPDKRLVFQYTTSSASPAASSTSNQMGAAVPSPHQHGGCDGRDVVLRQPRTCSMPTDRSALRDAV